MDKNLHLPHDISQRLRLLDILDRITQVNLASESMEEVLSGVLDLVLEIFGADRAWFLYPCDPDAPFWYIPMERTRPEWPGLFSQGGKNPMTREASEILRTTLESDGAIQYGPHADYPLPQHVAEQFSLKSQMQIVLQPKIGCPWMFGVHHCVREVIHGEEDLQLFTAIAQRISETLSSLISTRQLRESEEKLRGLYELSPLGIALTDLSGRHIEFNKAYQNICGYSEQELKSLNRTALLSNRHKTDHARQLESLQRHGHYGPYEEEFIRKNGSLIPLQINSLLINGIDNQKYIWSIAEDVTERKRIETDLRVAATTFEAQEGMLITDANGTILRVNCAFTNITGYTQKEILGKDPRILSSGRHDSSFYSAMWESIQHTGSWEGEIWNKRKNGEIYPEHLVITAVKDQNNIVTHYVATFNDITASKAAADEIRSLAFYDPLTRLPNRRLLLDRLQQALLLSVRTGRQGALLFIDLDNFKSINDTQGHTVGDLLLIEAANRLQACIRKGDTTARLGGDEFVVLLEDLDNDEPVAAAHAETIGEKILDTIRHPYLINGIEQHSTASIGITLFRGPVITMEEMLKRADVALYQAKADGRNIVRFFDPAMQAAVTTRVTLETDLRRAVAEQEQFLLYYQAQVDSSGHLIGAEALLRWQHPVRGMVSPAEFIPLAEETGLILPLGHWVMATACQQLAAWSQRAETAHLTLAVNVSAKQFRLPVFVDEVLALVDYFKIDPAKLKLEITESLLLDNVDDIIAKMNALKARGISFAMDDFGTGYSSLSYLKRLPLFQLKIDQTFVRDVLTDPNDAAIAKIIVALAQTMNLAVIAEGVETEAQRHFLEQNGCHAFQGYLFGKPIPIEEFELALKARIDILMPG